MRKLRFSKRTADILVAGSLLTFLPLMTLTASPWCWLATMAYLISAFYWIKNGV